MGKKPTLINRRNVQAAINFLDPKYQDTTPLQGKVRRTTRCIVCGDWRNAPDWKPVTCEDCRRLL